MNEKEIMELVEKAIAKDNQAMETLYKTYYKDVLFVCKKLSLNDADANDITQDAFIDAFSKLNTLKDKKKFKQWICKVANNKALNLLKHNNVLKLDNIDDDNSFTEIPDKEKAAEQQVIDNEVADILKNIIEKLPLEQKITVFMFYYEDMSVKEIASAYGISENTVRSRLNYAKKFITFEINKLEDKGVKLRSTAALPFLYLLFTQEKEAFAASIVDSAIPSSASIIAKVMKNSISSNSSNTVTSTTTATTTAKVAGAAAKTFSIGKIIGISSTIVAVIAAAVIGITMLGNNDKDDKKDDDKTTVSWKDTLENEDDKNNDSEDNDSENSHLEDNNTSEDTENTDEEVEYETGNEHWNYYEMDPVTLPEITYTKVEYMQLENGPLTAYIADTMFQLTPEEITEKMKNSEYLKSKNEEYIFANDLEEECTYTYFTDIGVQKQYEVGREILAYSKSHVDEVISTSTSKKYRSFYSDFRVYMSTDYTNYTTPNYIVFNISHIDINREEQDKAFAYLTDFLGEDLAKYLVYSGDSQNIEETIKVGDTTYTLERNLHFDNDEENSDGLSFVIEITHSYEKNNSYYNGDYVSVVNKDVFSPEKYIRGNFGSTNLDDLVNFGSEYMEFGVNEKYVGTSPERLKYVINNNPDGTTEECFFLDTLKGCEEVALLVCPEFDISIYHTTENNEVIDYSIEFTGGLGLASAPDDDAEPDYTPLYAPLVGKLKALLGDTVDISSIDLNAFNECKGITFTSTYFDKPCEGYISYDYGVNMAGLVIGEYTLRVEMTN